jgi:hypothetical protein
LHLVKCPKNTLHTSACRGHYGQGKAFFVFLGFQAQLIAPGWTLKFKKAPKGVPPLYIMIPSRKSNPYVKRGSRSQLKDLMLKGELDDFNYTQRVFKNRYYFQKRDISTTWQRSIASVSHLPSS